MSKTRLEIPLELQKALAVLLPLVALLLGIFLVYPAYTGLETQQAALRSAQSELAKLRAESVVAEDRIIPAVVADEEEPNLFVGELRTIARASGCEFRQVTMLTPGSRSSEVQARRARLTVRGTYAGVRRLLANLKLYRRLLAVTDLTASEEPGRQVLDRSAIVRAEMTIERYVAMPGSSVTPGGGDGAVATTAPANQN